jgi:hypothetical protein
MVSSFNKSRILNSSALITVDRVQGNFRVS